ncbi:MAG: hypothetical protein R3257_03325, partial [bacterium]|nr:hypothetical protein [bacterium]
MSPPIRFYLGHATQEENEATIPGNPVPNEASPSGENLAMGQQTSLGRGLSFMEEGELHLRQLQEANPEMTALQGAQDYLSRAGGDHIGNFKLASMLLASHAARAQGPELQQVQATATEMATEILNLFRGPSQSQLRWNGTNGPLSNAQQARTLIELTLNLGFIFDRTGQEEVNSTHQQLLGRLLERAEQYFVANQQEAEAGEARPLPPLLGNFVRAQRALLDGNVDRALPSLIAAQGNIQELDRRSPPTRAGGLRNQIRFSVMMALQNLAQDVQAFNGQNARTRVSLSALGYTYFSQQIGEEASEEEQEQLLRKVQQFNIFASLMLNDGLSGQNANQLLEFLNQFNQANEEDRAQLLQLFQNNYGKNETFQAMLGEMGFDPQNPSQVWEALLNSAREVGAYLYQHRNEPPFVQILAQDIENRPVSRAAQILDQDGLLRSSILQAMGLRDNPEQPIRGEDLVPLLLQYGPHLNRYLENTLPETIREGEHYSEFVGILNNAIAGLSAEGIGQNFTQPVEGLLEIMRGMSQADERYDTALFLLSQEIAATEEIMPGVAMPASLINQARETATGLEGFRWDRFIENTVANPEFWSMTVLGSGAALLGEIALLRRAGSAGRLWRLVRNGRLTGLGHLAVGMGVAGTMTMSGSLVHSFQNPEHQFMTADNWYRMTTSTLAMGVAMGATMGWSRFIQGRMGIAAGSGASIPRLQRLGIYASGMGVGTAAMTFGGMANHWWHEGQWQWATGEQWAETALTLFVWERLGHWGWRPLVARRWPQALVGPHQMENTVNLSAARILELNPELGWEPVVLRDYLAREYLAGRFRPVLQGLVTPRIPYLRDLGSRRVLDYRNPTRDEYNAHFREAVEAAQAQQAPATSEPAPVPEPAAEPAPAESATAERATSPVPPLPSPRPPAPPRPSQPAPSGS